VQLVINRSQQDVKGMMGGHKGVQFTLAYRLVLSDDEAALVQRYKLQDYALTWRTLQGTRVADDTISNMVQGRTQTVRDVTTLLDNEEIVKGACDQLPSLFAVVRSFGGQEVIEFPRVGVS
jgi:hypothetical protein